MVKSKTRASPVTGGVRKNRNRDPSMERNGDSTLVKYSALGISITTDANGEATPRRIYAPGNINGLTSTVGAGVVSYYSTAKFLPGTKIRWEPSVSFTTSGRVYCGFTDNPEVMNTILASPNPATWKGYVQGLGNIVSFPVWQETEVPVPLKLRRKMFDSNLTYSAGTPSVDELDRTAQTCFFVYVTGPANTNVGSFWYHDRLQVEGLHPTVT